jgi:hypothetical protein
MSFAINGAAVNNDPKKETKDSVASVQAFMEVYKVLMSARCMNCHPAGDIPLQGDDSHLHTMSPQRGKDGHGVYAMKCSNCHQPTNSPGLNAPPGNPKWALPPGDMKMVFEGKTPRQLALQIMDYKRNGHKTECPIDRACQGHSGKSRLEYGRRPQTSAIDLHRICGSVGRLDQQRRLCAKAVGCKQCLSISVFRSRYR